MISVERIDAVPETRVCDACSKTTGADTGLAVTTRTDGKANSLKPGNTVVVKTEIVRRKPRN
jgi:hypothetical protein